MDIQALKLAGSLGALGPGERVQDGPNGFSKALNDLVKEADEMQKQAESTVEAASMNGGEDFHDVMIAMNKADLSFRMMLEVRNKLVEAYQEVMRIPV